MKNITAALETMNQALINRKSILVVEESRTAVSAKEALDRIKASVLSTFEERCAVSGVIKASWIFHRHQERFVLNRTFRNKAIVCPIV